MFTPFSTQGLLFFLPKKTNIAKNVEQNNHSFHPFWGDLGKNRPSGDSHRKQQRIFNQSSCHDTETFQPNFSRHQMATKQKKKESYPISATSINLYETFTTTFA